MTHLLYGKKYSIEITTLCSRDLGYYGCYLDPNIKYFINLQHLSMRYGRIEIIPNDIQYLVNLVELDLSNNCISIIPSEIKYLVKLTCFTFTPLHI